MKFHGTADEMLVASPALAAGWGRPMTAAAPIRGDIEYALVIDLGDGALPAYLLPASATRDE